MAARLLIGRALCSFLAAHLTTVSLDAMNKGKAAKLKLFIAIRESIHIALLRIKINLSGIYEDAHTLKDWQHHIVGINTLTIILYYLINIFITCTPRTWPHYDIITFCCS